ncbi:patatin-like phospholipase family protein [Lebetimonas sp. JS032]|uniref:patatin-like phospholipase family protein n=1 Tax=Lebetimonas sp. JS032 TaxID=990070 RepID=UPI000464161D|nr:patatin-like phospholipase family protein [Lebetimonas sp. JS032]
MKVSLVLSGGGARGYTHIGVIKELKKYGFEIISISGTSMGALIGALEACNKLEVYENWVKNLDVLDMIKFLNNPLAKNGWLNGDKIFNKIKELVGDYKIEDLPVKFTAVATDLNKKKEVWFQKGPLWEAVKASASIPGIFQPVKLNKMLLVDGGVLNIMPIAPVMSDMSDLIIAVNLYGNDKEIKIKLSKEVRKKQNLMEEIWYKIFKEKQDPVNQSIDLMMDTIFRYRRAEYSADIEIEIPENIAKWYEFHRAIELIKIGEEFTKDAINSAKKKGIIKGENSESVKQLKW